LRLRRVGRRQSRDPRPSVARRPCFARLDGGRSSCGLRGSARVPAAILVGPELLARAASRGPAAGSSVDVRPRSLGARSDDIL
jgi:hypothetical protein